MRALLVAAMSSSVAHAEPPGLTVPTARPVEHKSKSVAMWFTLGTMTAGTALLALDVPLAQHSTCTDSCALLEVIAVTGGAALLVGPSIGHLYAGHLWNAGLGIRLGGMVSLGIGWLVLMPCMQPNGPSGGTCAMGGTLATLGALATVAGTVTEVATTPSAVDDYNRAHATLTLAPIRTQDGIAPGLALAGRF